MAIYVQYSNSPILVRYIELLRLFLNSSSDFDTLAWIDAYLSIATADTDGLDNWGRILGRDRLVVTGNAFQDVIGITDPNANVPNTLKSYRATNNYIQNFANNQNLPNDSPGGHFFPNIGGATALNDTAYRPLLQLLYSKYTNNNTLASMNAIIKAYAQQTGKTQEQIDGTYVTENVTSPMSILYYFDFDINLTYEYNLFVNENILPKPTGVSLLVQWNPSSNPSVVLTSPNPITNVSVNPTITLTFSEAVFGVNNNSIQLQSSTGTIITITITQTGNSYTLGLSGALVNATQYLVIIGNGITSKITGLPLIATQFNFTTA